MKLRQPVGKMVVDGLVALLAVAGVGAFAWLGTHHHPVLAVVIGVPLFLGGLSAFHWVEDHDQ